MLAKGKKLTIKTDSEELTGTLLSYSLDNSSNALHLDRYPNECFYLKEVVDIADKPECAYSEIEAILERFELLRNLRVPTEQYIGYVLVPGFNKVIKKSWEDPFIVTKNVGFDLEIIDSEIADIKWTDFSVEQLKHFVNLASDYMGRIHNAGWVHTHPHNGNFTINHKRVLSLIDIAEMVSLDSEKETAHFSYDYGFLFGSTITTLVNAMNLDHPSYEKAFYESICRVLRHYLPEDEVKNEAIAIFNKIPCYSRNICGNKNHINKELLNI